MRPHATLAMRLSSISRPARQLQRPLQRRRITPARRNASTSNGHQTYFQRDAPSPNPTSSPRPATKSRAWLAFLAGFAAFPFAYSWLAAGWWVLSPVATPDDAATADEARQIQEADGVSPEDAALLNPTSFLDFLAILERRNSDTKMLHDLLLIMMDRSRPLRVSLDNTLLTTHPVRMSDGKMLAPGRALLARLRDRQGRTVALMLAADGSGHEHPLSDPDMQWSHDAALREWLMQRAIELGKAGEFPDLSVSLFLYTPSSTAMAYPVKGEVWQESRVWPGEAMQGFPLAFFRRMPRDGDGNGDGNGDGDGDKGD